MLKEIVREPLEAAIARTTGHVGLNQAKESVEEVVGLDFGLDSEGYCRSIYSSGDPVYNISSAEDVYAWFTKKDTRLLFVAEGDWLGPLLKWFGEEALIQYRGLIQGYPMKFGRCRLSYLPGNGYTNVLEGRHRARKVSCLQSYYHMYGLPPVTDAMSIKDLGQRIIDTQLRYSLPIETKSPGAMLQSYILGDGIRPVSVGRVPREVLDIASNCYHTNLVVAVAGGAFSKAYDYDLVSAYPSYTAKLVSCDPAFGSWFPSSQYQDEAFYGFCRIRIKVSAFMTPLLCRILPGLSEVRVRQINPVGTWEGWLTKQEIDFVVRRLDAEISIEDGWWFVPHTDLYPYKGSMLKLYGLRQEAKVTGDKFGSNLLKLSGVAAQGKFLSTFPLYGKLVGSYMRNPVYAAYITAGVRCKLGDFILDHWGHVLHVAVDGVALNEFVEVPGVFGEFGLDSDPVGEECIVAGDGQYWRRSRQSVFQKSTLELHADEDAYPDLRSTGRFSLGLAAARKCSLAKVGTVMPGMPEKVPAGDFSTSLRNFSNKPYYCKDLLSKQFDSEARLASGGN